MLWAGGVRPVADSQLTNSGNSLSLLSTPFSPTPKPGGNRFGHISIFVPFSFCIGKRIHNPLICFEDKSEWRASFLFFLDRHPHFEDYIVFVSPIGHEKAECVLSLPMASSKVKASLPVHVCIRIIFLPYTTFTVVLVSSSS